MAPARKRQKTFRVRLRRFLLWLIRLRGSPHAIAGGFAIGTGVAFTPTIGLQGLIALGLATVLGANRPVAILLTWSTNPPVFGFTYYLGSFFWSGPEVASVVRAMGDVARSLASLDAFAIREQFSLFVLLGAAIAGARGAPPGAARRGSHRPQRASRHASVLFQKYPVAPRASLRGAGKARE